jgi:Mitochondrial carrier protein
VSFAQPTDVVKVRMQAAQTGGRYAGCIDAYRTIAAQEGVRGLWKGTYDVILSLIGRLQVVTCKRAGLNDARMT